MSAIHWPEHYLPGTTDNFVSNAVVAAGLTAAEVWRYLEDTTWWEAYYPNVRAIGFDGGAGPRLAAGVRFRFTTFTFPVECEVVEYVAPQAGEPGRLAWRAWIDGSEAEKLDVLHAWLIEDLPGGRVRVLTEESQWGEPAKAMAVTRPNPMLNAHQDWLDGLVRTAREQKREG